MEQVLRKGKSWLCIDLSQMDYLDAWDFQQRLVQARKSGEIGNDLVLLLEHPSVFTLGRRGGRENLTVSETFLEQSRIPIVPVERGGNITYHGPGQLVAYPIIDLHASRLRVRDYVEKLEELMILTAARWGIQASRNPLNNGVWVGGRKLGSIGIAIRRGVTFHGFALNVNVRLDPFQWINPCGLQGVEMTSMERELSAKPSMPEVREVVKHYIQTIFNVNIVILNDAETRMILNGLPL